MNGAERDEEATVDTQTSDELRQAMQAAVEAVELRELGDAPTAEGEAPGANAPPKTADEAITEALFKAKRELEQMVVAAKEDSKQLKDRWIRAAADLENFKKRAAREREEIVKFGNERILKDMLPMLDDLDRTLEALPKTVEDTALQTLSNGVRMVHKKFLAQLERYGVTTFPTVGEAFDPTQHEAVHQLHSDEVSPGGVAAELRRGFLLNGRLLRPAMVAVSVGPETPEAAPGEETSGE